MCSAISKPDWERVKNLVSRLRSPTLMDITIFASLDDPDQSAFAWFCSGNGKPFSCPPFVNCLLHVAAFTGIFAASLAILSAFSFPSIRWWIWKSKVGIVSQLSYIPMVRTIDSELKSSSTRATYLHSWLMIGAWTFLLIYLRILFGQSYNSTHFSFSPHRHILQLNINSIRTRLLCGEADLDKTGSIAR